MTRPPPSTPPVATREISGLPTVGDGSGLSPDNRYYPEEIQLALRNRGLPLEALRYPVTPAGLHYLLVHFDIPAVETGRWQLTVGGQVARPLQLSLADIKARRAVTVPVTMECAGNGRARLSPRSLSQPWLCEAVSTAQWTGTPLRGVLEEAGIVEGAEEIVFTGEDWGVQGGEVQPYQRSLTVTEALRDDVLLVYAMNGEPLPAQHGYPLRLLVPGWYGMTSVKWLTAIEVSAEPFDGFQMVKSYRDSLDAEDPGLPISLIRPKSLVIPPGIPDFVTRVRILSPGPVTLQGRAWVGRADIATVEVSLDGGTLWRDAELEAPMHGPAWRGWTYRWEAKPGRYTLCVRATDTTGETQPFGQRWNYQGMGNNMVQRVEVMVVP
ncbi:sulfite oxidase [Arhodomonas sp. AD133]|uniref:sulfite oxidase n=1 Tax=Arhodomonas sp. AD133 TaxID=3415009 RepID=UPI003EBB6661